MARTASENREPVKTMLRGILPDANCEGHFQQLLRALHDEERREFWHFLNLAIVNFEDLGLASDASDRDLWEQCQRQDVILITANRNAAGPDSLVRLFELDPIQLGAC